MHIKIFFLMSWLVASFAVVVASDPAGDLFCLTESSASSPNSFARYVSPVSCASRYEADVYEEVLITKLGMISAAAGWGLPKKGQDLEGVIEHMIGDAQKMQEKKSAFGA